jgi:hypothetical protein
VTRDSPKIRCTSDATREDKKHNYSPQAGEENFGISRNIPSSSALFLEVHFVLLDSRDASKQCDGEVMFRSGSF